MPWLAVATVSPGDRSVWASLPSAMKSHGGMKLTSSRARSWAVGGWPVLRACITPLTISPANELARRSIRASGHCGRASAMIGRVAPGEPLDGSRYGAAGTFGEQQVLVELPVLEDRLENEFESELGDCLPVGAEHGPGLKVEGTNLSDEVVEDEQCELVDAGELLVEPAPAESRLARDAGHGRGAEAFRLHDLRQRLHQMALRRDRPRIGRTSPRHAGLAASLLHHESQSNVVTAHVWQ